MKIILMTMILISLLSTRLNAQVAQIADPRDSESKVEIGDFTTQVTYRAKIYIDTLKKDYYYDNQVLEIGDKYSRYYSAFAENIDSVKYKVKKRIIKVVGDSYSPKMFLGKYENGTYEDILTDYPEAGVMTVFVKFMKKTYKYEEAIPKFNWNITNERDSIMGYECIMATTSFRGRDYKVWFTLSIPISLGPWKFSGLPGLILKVEDSQKLFNYTAIGINTRGGVIHKYDEPFTIAKRKDILKMNDLRWINLALLLKTNGSDDISYAIKGSDGKLVKIDTPPVADYIPQIELE